MLIYKVFSCAAVKQLYKFFLFFLSLDSSFQFRELSGSSLSFPILFGLETLKIRRGIQISCFPMEVLSFINVQCIGYIFYPVFLKLFQARGKVWHLLLHLS